jgi:hypothetical protein
LKWFQSLPARRRAVVASGLIVLCIAAVALPLRNGRSSTARQALSETFKKYPQLHRQEVARFAGKIVIDGMPPGNRPPRSALFVSLHRMRPGQEVTEPLHALCDAAGHFAFNTYVQGDGVAIGTYVVTIVSLRRSGRHAFGPPDEFNNLYNDPDKNAERTEFLVNVTPPGKTDYQFDLTVAGQEPVETPGPHAVTTIATW